MNPNDPTSTDVTLPAVRHAMDITEPSARPKARRPSRKAAHSCGSDDHHTKADGAVCGICELRQGAVRIEHAVVMRDGGGFAAKPICDPCGKALRTANPNLRIFCNPTAALREALLQTALEQCIPPAKRGDEAFRTAIIHRVRQTRPTDVQLGVLDAVEAELAEAAQYAAALVELEDLITQYGKSVRDIKRSTFAIMRDEGITLTEAVARARNGCEYEIEEIARAQKEMAKAEMRRKNVAELAASKPGTRLAYSL